MHASIREAQSYAPRRRQRPPALVTGSAGRGLGQRVAALQGALGVVGAQRHRGFAQRLAAALQARAAERSIAAPRRRSGGRGSGALDPAAPRPLEHHRRDPPLEAGAFGQPAFGGGADLADLLVELAALALQRPRRARAPARQVAGAGPDRPLPRPPQRDRAALAGSPRAARQSSGTAASAAWVGVEQATAATSSIRVESRSWPIALTTGTRSIATVRQSVSSQKAQRSARLPPPRVTTIASTSGRAASPWIAAAIAGAAWRSCTGAKAQTTVPAPAAPPQRRRAGRAGRRRVSAVTTPIVFGSSGRAQLLLQLEQALGPQLLAQRLQPGQQVALAGQPHVGGAEAEAGRGLAAARVVVGPAGDHQFGAVAQRPLRQPRLLEVVEPDRAGHRALAVAQLEVGLDLAAPDPGHLADQLHPRPLAHLLLRACARSDRRERARADPCPAG